MSFLKKSVVLVFLLLPLAFAQIKISPSSKDPSYSEVFDTGSSGTSSSGTSSSGTSSSGTSSGGSDSGTTASLPISHKYIFSLPTVKVNWHKARDLCEMFGFELASILNDSEYQAFKDAHKAAKLGKERIWLGGSDLATEGKFMWTTSPPTPLTYTQWQAIEPNGEKVENCVELFSDSDYAWNDVRCSHTFMFACKNKNIS